MPEAPLTPVDFTDYDPRLTYQSPYLDWEDDNCPACGRATERHSSTQLTHCGQFARLTEETT